MRIAKSMSQTRENYVYNSLKAVPPKSVSDIQADLKNPVNNFGGTRMNAKRIYEIKNLVKSGLPLPEKVYIKRSKNVKPSIVASASRSFKKIKTGILRFFRG